VITINTQLATEMYYAISVAVNYLDKAFLPGLVANFGTTEADEELTQLLSRMYILSLDLKNIQKDIEAIKQRG